MRIGLRLFVGRCACVTSSLRISRIDDFFFLLVDFISYFFMLIASFLSRLAILIVSRIYIPVSLFLRILNNFFILLLRNRMMFFVFFFSCLNGFLILTVCILDNFITRFLCWFNCCTILFIRRLLSSLKILRVKLALILDQLLVDFLLSISALLYILRDL